MEIWKDIKGFEGIYQVSNLGRVKSLSRIKMGTDKKKYSIKESILAGGKERTGYLLVHLRNNNKSYTKKIHKLVAAAFLGHKPCGYKLVVNHINFIKTDNRAENLEITTQRENSNKKHIKSSSIYTGVCYDKGNKKWRASIKVDGKLKFLGLFDCEKKASESYQNKLNTLT